MQIVVFEVMTPILMGFRWFTDLFPVSEYVVYYAATFAVTFIVSIPFTMFGEIIASKGKNVHLDVSSLSEIAGEFRSSRLKTASLAVVPLVAILLVVPSAVAVDSVETKENTGTCTVAKVDSIASVSFDADTYAVTSDYGTCTYAPTPGQHIIDTDAGFADTETFHATGDGGFTSFELPTSWTGMVGEGKVTITCGSETFSWEYDDFAFVIAPKGDYVYQSIAVGTDKNYLNSTDDIYGVRIYGCVLGVHGNNAYRNGVLEGSVEYDTRPYMFDAIIYETGTHHSRIIMDGHNFSYLVGQTFPASVDVHLYREASSKTIYCGTIAASICILAHLTYAVCRIPRQ